MRRKLIYALAIALAAVTALAVKQAALPAPAQPAGAQAPEIPGQVIAALGRVEPRSEEVRIAAEIPGKIARILVREGSRVHSGDLLAVLENQDLQAQLGAARARLDEKEAELRRLLNGARPQERAEAWAAVNEADAVLENARIEAQRRESLSAQNNIAPEEVDRADRALRVAMARADGVRQHFELLNSPAREEDRTQAEAAVEEARSAVMQADARLEKSKIRSPLNGIILRAYLKAGESVSSSPEMPIFTLGDTSRLRVRAEVDESDIGKIRLGAQARIKAAAFRDRIFTGRVVSIGPSLGRKRVSTDRAAERADTDILETLIDLDDHRTLRPGLRVDVFITLAAGGKK